MTGELWRELGESMRRVRRGEGLSLRQVEAMSGWARGTLSQVENAKAHPSAELVEWYDRTFHGHGLLASAYSAARSAQPGPGPIDQPAVTSVHTVVGDEMRVLDSVIPSGLRVRPGCEVSAGWRLVNSGSVPWRERQLRRIGPHAGVRTIACPPSVPIPPTDPSDVVLVRILLRAPDLPGSVVGYWRVVDQTQRSCFPDDALLSVLLVVE